MIFFIYNIHKIRDTLLKNHWIVRGNRGRNWTWKCTSNTRGLCSHCKYIVHDFSIANYRRSSRETGSVKLRELFLGIASASVEMHERQRWTKNREFRSRQNRNHSGYIDCRGILSKYEKEEVPIRRNECARQLSPTLSHYPTL